MPNSSTGFSLLPDFGTLFYNGVTFSALYTSKITGAVIQDDAKRTTKYLEYLLEVDGLVTLNPGLRSTDTLWKNLRQQLSAHAGVLRYEGQGFGGLVVNQPGNPVQDVAFGPVPTVISFQPLGQGRSAFIKWQVIARVAEVPLPPFSPIKTPGPHPLIVPVLQYNYDAQISYDEEGYSTLSLRGVVEIPMTRATATTRTLSNVVDNYRQSWLDIEFDLTKFRVTSRNFTLSRDKRRIDWDYRITELAPLGMPAGATIARGNFNVRPAIHIPPWGIMSDKLWYATLRCTYSIRADFPRETALHAFYAMWSFRMRLSAFGNVPNIDNQGNTAQQQQDSQSKPNLVDAVAASGLFNPFTVTFSVGYFYNRIFQEQAKPPDADYKAAWVTDFTIDEGLYLDSKSITFSAAWLLTATFATIVSATGIWKRPADVGDNTWAASMQGIVGWKSWLANRIDPAADVIVDMGGGTPPFPPGPILP